MLPRFQVEAGRDLNYKVCYPRSSFDAVDCRIELLKYYFLRLAGIPSMSRRWKTTQPSDKISRSAPRDYFYIAITSRAM
jgi:hypothetical protein